MTLTFAETHNMIAYLSKSDSSEGFNQIIDFLNGSSINVADDVVPTTVEEQSIPSPKSPTTPSQDQPSTSQGRMIADMDADVDVTLKDVAVDVKDVAAQDAKIDERDLTELQEVVEVVTTAKLITKVVTAASATITAATPQLTTAAAPTLTTAPSVARRRTGVKLDEEVEELKRHLQIVPNDEDDVYTKATPLARKIITFTTTQLILLAEKRYPLTSITLDQMVNNVRLEAEEESEVSLELLRCGRPDFGQVLDKGSGVGRGVKEKCSKASNIEVVKDGVVPSVLVNSRNVAKEVELPTMVEENVVKEKQCPMLNTTFLGSYPPLPTHATSSAGNAPAVMAIGRRCRKSTWTLLFIKVKLHGVPVTAFSKDGLSVIATKLDTPLMRDSYTSYMYMQSWGRSNYARAMIELRADVELKDNNVVAMPKIKREGHYILGPKMGFKPQKEYRHVPKKFTASSSGNKKTCVEPTIEVSNANPFEVLNSVDNDVELGTNVGTTNLVNNGATLSGSSFTNVDNNSTSTTIINKIGKFEELLSSRKANLVDEAGNPLKKVEYPDDYDSEDEVASVDNDMARSMVAEMIGFGTQSFWNNERIRMENMSIVAEKRGNGTIKGKDKDTYEHVERVLEIVGLFNIPRVSMDAIMLRVFPVTLTGATKRHGKGIMTSFTNIKSRESSGGNSKTDDHSENWHDEGSLGRSSSDEISTITNKLDNLGQDMRKLKQSMHVIQVGCEMCGGMHSKKLPPKRRDLGASISVMPLSLFKRLSLGDPKPIRILIEITDKSIESPKGIIENILVPNDFGEQENLEDFLMNDDLNRDLGDFLDVNDLLPENNGVPFMVFSDSKSEMGIILDVFSRNLEDLLIEQASQFRKNE
nr:hypothetical protein [Tanacetum cinerariifolium]